MLVKDLRQKVQSQIALQKVQNRCIFVTKSKYFLAKKKAEQNSQKSGQKFTFGDFILISFCGGVQIVMNSQRVMVIVV